MSEERVFVFDQNNTLEDSQRNIFHHQRRPQEMTTFLVELPGLTTDSSRPHNETPPRLRKSTIVNTHHPPETTEDEEKPLEHFVRKHLSTFKRSLTPEDLQSDRRSASPKADALLVYPVTTQELNSDLKGNQNQMSPRTLTNTLQNDKELEGNEKQNKHVKETVSLKSGETTSAKERRRGKRSKNPVEQRYDTDVVVMPALEPVSVSHDSPFVRESMKQMSYMTPSRVKVLLTVEPSDDEPDVHRRPKKKSPQRKGDSSTRRNSSYKQSSSRNTKGASLNSGAKAAKGLERSPTARGRRDTLELSTVKKSKSLEPDELWKRKHSRSDSKQKEVFLQLNNSKRRNDSRDMRHKSERGDSGRDYETSKINGSDKTSQKGKPSRDDSNSGANKRASIRSSSRDYGSGKGRNSSAQKGKVPFNTQAEYSVFRADYPTANTTGHYPIPPDVKREEPVKMSSAKYHTVKAPKSATKLVARRRYHIQIPEHNRPETWFNAHFNMDSENNVDMTYEGPVKITNYYTSNKYV